MIKKTEDSIPHNPQDSLPDFKTSDLYLSSYLKARKIIFKGVERRDGRIFFIFQNDETTQTAARDYHNGGLVDALLYKNSLLEFRVLIHNPENVRLINEEKNEQGKEKSYL